MQIFRMMTDFPDIPGIERWLSILYLSNGIYTLIKIISLMITYQHKNVTNSILILSEENKIKLYFCYNYSYGKT